MTEKKDHYKVLVIGDAIVDRYIFGKINRQSPEDSSIPIIDIERTEERLGGCLNVAVNIKSLRKTMDVSVSSVLDQFGYCGLLSRQINVNYSMSICEDCALIKTRIINLKDNKQLIRFDKNQRFLDSIVDEFIQFHFNKIDLNIFDCIVVSDYLKGTVTSDVIMALQKFKGMVFVDTKHPSLSMWDNIPNVILKINKREWKNSTVRTRHPLVVTMGEGGAFLFDSRMLTYSVEPIENADVIGCGDVFLAGLVVKYLETKDLGVSIKYANKAARESAKYQGTVEVKLNE